MTTREDHEDAAPFRSPRVDWKSPHDLHVRAESPTIIVQERAINVLGTVALVTSLTSIMTCGALAPLGILFGVCALFSRPRGQAWASIFVGAAVLVAWLAILGAFGFVTFHVFPTSR